MPPPPKKKPRRQVELPGKPKHNPRAAQAELTDGMNRLRKMRLVNLNRQIAEHAKAKNLSAAIACFRQAVKLRVANTFTHVILMNAYVCCGDAAGAARILRKMRNRGGSPDVVAYTTAIKGYCEAGDLQRAEKLLSDMTATKPTPIVPNVRTCNTLLRGYILVGAVEQVQQLLARMKTEWHISPDGSTIEYAGTLLCQGLRVAQARALLSEPEMKDFDDPVAVAAVRLALTRAYVLLGQWKAVQAEITILRTIFDRMERDAAIDKQAVDSHAENTSTTDDGASSNGYVQGQSRASGGRRSWKSNAGSKSDTSGRERSAIAFRSHRVTEWRREMLDLQNFTERAKAEAEQGRCTPAQRRENTLRRVFLFPLPGSLQSYKEMQLEPSRLAERLAKALCESFGAGIDINADVNDGKIRSVENSTAIRAALYKKQLDSEGYVDWSHVFQRRKPIHLEIGSGSGEWACAQAAAIADVDWVTLEMRIDRCFHTYLKALTMGVSNLCVMGGDALHLLPRHIAPASVDGIWVNHPEPPHQYDTGDRACHAAHMLTPVFFAASHRVLRPRARLIILTDNANYAQLLLKIVARLSSGGLRHFHNIDLETSLGGGSDLSIHSVSGEIRLYSVSTGTQGAGIALSRALSKASGGSDAISVVGASSYFDRLWKSGASKSAAQTQRFVLCLRRSHVQDGSSDTTSSNEQVKSSINETEESTTRVSGSKIVDNAAINPLETNPMRKGTKKRKKKKRKQKGHDSA